MSSKGRDSQVTGDKERPAALVVCSYLGWPITGGVAAAIRQLIYFLHSIGLAIYCTAFKVSDNDQNEFREFDVNLIYPDPPDLYRLEEESISWLHNHDTYFPEINKVERVKMVFGFSMVTSFQASAIRNKTFPDASFYLVNPYKLDTPLNILGYNKTWFKAWKKSLAETTKEAKAVFSIGSEIFNHFDSYDSLEMAVNHLSLMLTPDNELFKIKRRCKDPTSGNFHILTFVDAHDISELSSESTLAKAMNYVADSFHKMKREPPKWTIVSVPKGSEGVIKSSLDPHPHLQIIYKSLDASEAITLLKQSHLLLVPPSSTNSVNLSLSTIATGTPLLVPLYSPSHKAIMGYLPETDPDDIVVDMKGSHTILGDKIIDVMTYYPAYHKRASTMRDDMELKANEVSNQMKSMLKDLIYKHEDLKLTNPFEKSTVGQGQLSACRQSDEAQNTATSGNLQLEPEAKRRKLENDDTSRQHSLEGDIQPSTNVETKETSCQTSLREESKGSCPSRLQTEPGAKEHNEVSKGANHGTGSSTSNSSTGDETHSDNDGENKYQRKPGHMGVKCVSVVVCPRTTNKWLT
ncbi:uncharacterized protein [Ptychodera flava]|uniref:uncharacterized protein n=1 Tax=Ptychodera flava TaxID=63121 RepID=UPI00396A997B